MRRRADNFVMESTALLLVLFFMILLVVLGS